jgi:hypothetical protein
MINDYIFKLGEVRPGNDPDGGDRIKVRLKEDSNVADQDLPWCFPILPKMNYIIPKPGESVFVFVSRSGKYFEDRFWIGPIISQLNKISYDPFYYSARSFLSSGYVLPEENPLRNKNAIGIYPDRDDIAMIGRYNTDIVHKDNVLNIRCGVASQTDKTSFNTKDIGFVQMVYKSRTDKNGNNPYNTSINIVSDKINLISYQSAVRFNTTDRKELITDAVMQDILDRAHVLPYGDILVDFLKLFLKSYTSHVHSYPGNPPIIDKNMTNLLTFNLNDMLSQSIRIN